MSAIARDPKYRPVLYFLSKNQNKPLSQREIAEGANYSLATIKRHLCALKALNVVEWEEVPGKLSCYRVDKTIERLVIAN